MHQLLIYLVASLCFVNLARGQGTNNNQSEALEFLEKYDVEGGKMLNLVMFTKWNFDTNITDYNQGQHVKQLLIAFQLQKAMRNEALLFNASAMCANAQRQLNKVKNIGTSAEPNATKIKELTTILAKMQSIYGKGEVCLLPENCWPLEPDISEFMAKSRDYDTLQNLWSGWRDATGKKMRSMFPKYVELSNEAVQHLGYKDLGEQWRSVYESATFVDDVADLFDQVRPLYEQLHAFVRRRLMKLYGESRFPDSGHIPAHILGDMWAQTWTNIVEVVKPFVDKGSIDVTQEMIRQNYTVEKMFRTAEDFFVSLGFDQMVPTFWTKSMLEKPDDGRKVVCHPSAWDFFDREDFRIKMCTSVNQEDLMRIHHEMGHVQYYMQYKDQPVVYRREGANPGFHEAVGDVMSLSVQTPEHMKKLGLIDEVPTDKETDINFLMNMALQKVAFLPFGYLVDQWRWSVFDGKITPENYNERWWNLRCHLQGISSPVERSEEDLDPAAKYHVPAGVPYIRYFVSHIIQFQFYKAACEAADYTGPLHRCDIYNSKEAGRKIRAMLQLGMSKPWPVAMKQLTEQDKMDASPLMEYFQPLLDYLREENGDDYGWDPSCPKPIKHKYLQH